MMRSRTAILAAALAFAAAAAGPAFSQQTLTPPDTHYFLSKGAWGQTFPDQWALGHIGFDASPQSAWRLVKRDATPVIVAVIDTGLDWNHRNIDWGISGSIRTATSAGTSSRTARSRGTSTAMAPWWRG
jgi:hypothetical protein